MSRQPLRCRSKQRVLADFASLKHASPDGIYVSLTPDPAIWSGVFFVQTGPYAPAILRFQIFFPPNYPDVPPGIIFMTDVFHPLVTPLTSYTYTADVSEADTVSASDEQRLPPGEFSLRHGFPQWYPHPTRVAATDSGSTSVDQTGRIHRPGDEYPLSTRHSAHAFSSPSAVLTAPNVPESRLSQSRAYVPMPEVLEYLRASFSDESILDSLPLKTAGNPGAWHAWRTHRSTKTPLINALSGGRLSESDSRELSGSSTSRSVLSSEVKARRPGEWNWDGVWEERVRKGIQSSLSEPVLYGSGGAGDDVIQFLDVDPTVIKEVATWAQP